MKHASHIQAAVELLEQVSAASNPADKNISGFFRKRRYIGSKDRRAIQDIVWRILRNQAKLKWWLDKADFSITKDEKSRALIIADLAFSDKNISELFSSEKYAPALLNEKENNLIAFLENKDLVHDEMPEWVKLECPEWLYEKLISAFGDNVSKELEALNEKAPVDIRINTLKTTISKAIEMLASESITAKSTELSPIGLRLDEGRYNLSSVKAFRDGKIEVQDEGSQLIALLTDAKPNQSVIDFCAGAGGKTLVLAASMKNKGKIIACDVSKKRLEESGNRIKRAGLEIVKNCLIENENDNWIQENAGKFDRVLVDAPCSGVGAYRRAPDARWHLSQEKLDEYTALQSSILKSASRLVASGGRLIYATCSMLQEENEQQAENFQENNNDFKSLPLKEIWSNFSDKPCPTENNYLKLTPAQHNTDGFFLAVWQKD